MLPRLLTILVLALFIGGCTSESTRLTETAINDFNTGNYPGAEQALKPLAAKTDEDFVLNNARLGSVTIADHAMDQAEAAFLNAYEVMNSVGVNNGGRTFGAVVLAEKIKVWKGEPFDRAMVNFYLGLIYYSRHDYNNARAAFENALFKLKDYGDEAKDPDKFRQVESGFSLGYLMLAKSWQRLGRADLANANFTKVAQLRPDLSALADPQLNANSNFLLVLDYGHGPRIVTDFNGSIAGFGPKPYQAGPIPMPLVYVDGRAMPTDNVARPTIDLLALAQDRVWQSIDTIRTVKSAVGTGLLAAGAVEGLRGGFERGSAQRRDLIAGAALAGAGLILKATSQADTRHWELLPRSTFVIPLTLPPGPHEIRADFYGGGAQTWQSVQIPPPGQETTLYMRINRWAEGPYQWAPDK